MLSISCPRTDCDYATGDYEAVVAAALLSAHATEHNSAGLSQQRSSVRPPPVDRPKLTRDIPKADWLIFQSRWKSFKAVKLIGQL